jgi:WD40 repeat protein
MTASKVTQSKPTTASEVRLVEVLEAYMAAAQEGRAPTRDELLAEHPELAEDLEACLASLEFIGRASLTAPPLILDSQPVDAHDGEAGSGDLGDFRLVREIGRGGMGMVYEAVQRSLNRRVALKVLPFAAAMDPIQLRRFQIEALAAGQLHHTHVVPVYSVGCERGVHYYAMQCIEGPTVAQVIAERKCLQEETGARHDTSSRGASALSREYFRAAAALSIQAAEALAHAHQLGIVHRDIKPANLLVDNQRSLWVTDFGLARLQDDTGLTISGDLLGTLRYMSPEQALAKRTVIDHRTDVYSLGATLYELVTLQPAIDGQDRQDILRKIAQEEPARPRHLNPAVPRDFETILLKAMNKEPELRYGTAQALADDLRRFWDDKPIKAKRATLLEKVGRWSRRHRLVVAAAAGVLLLATVGLAVATVHLAREQLRTREQRDIAEARTIEALDKRETLERNLYINLVNRARAEWSDGNVALADRLLDACPRERRGWEWYFTRKLCHTDLNTLRGHTQVVRSVAFDPRGRLVASVASDLDQSKHHPSELLVWEAATGRLVLARPGPYLNHIAFTASGLVAVAGNGGFVTFYDVTTGNVARTIGTRGSAPVERIAWSREGARMVLFRSPGKLELWDVRTGDHPEQTAPTAPNLGNALAMSPDGETVAIPGPEASIEVWDVRASKQIRTLRGPTYGIFALAFSGSGEMIASGEWDGTFRTWDTATGKPLLVLRGHQSFVRGVAFSPDGQHLASGAEDNSIKISDLAQGREVSTLNGHANSVIDVAYSPDGNTLASASHDKTVKLWDATGSPMGPVEKHSEWVTCVAFSHDGTRVATASRDGFVRILDAANGRVSLKLQHRVRLARQINDAVHGVVFGPDDQTLVSAGYDKTVKLWDLNSGGMLHAFRGHNNFIQSVAFAPDGRTIASVEMDGILRTWDAKSGAAVKVKLADARFLYTVVYSPDGKLLASAGASGWLRLWDTASLSLVQEIPAADYDGFGSQGRQVAFSPDSRRVVCPCRLGTAPGEVRVWDVATGNVLLCLRGHTQDVNGVAYSSDGLRIATASSDRSVRIWDAATGDELTALGGHRGSILCVDFDPSGRRLASGGSDFVARIWDAPRPHYDVIK